MKKLLISALLPIVAIAQDGASQISYRLSSASPLKNVHSKFVAMIDASDYAFSPKPGAGSLAPGSNTITMTPVPTGLNGTDTAHYLYVSGGTGTAEACLITGGTATSAASTGTVIMTCANSHSGAWTVQSAGGGIPEAYYSAIVPMTIGIPSGVIVLHAPLTINRDYVTLQCAGNQTTTLMGDFPSGDIVKVGTGSPSVVGFGLFGCKIDSSVVKVSGAGIHLNNVVRSALTNVYTPGQDGSANLLDGMWFDKVDAVYVNGFQANSSRDAIRINGTVGGGAKAGLFMMQGKVQSSTNCVHVGGAFGGLNLDQTDIIACSVGLLIDTALAAEQNREIFIGPTVAIDSNTTYGIYLNEPFNNGYLGLSGTWIASNTDGLGIASGACGNCTINYTGGTIFSNSGNGVLNNSDAGAKINISNVAIRYNGIGLNQNVATASAAVNFRVSGNVFSNNTLDVNGYIGLYLASLSVGLNNDLPISTSSTVDVIAPMGLTFTITGLQRGAPGQIINIVNNTTSTMTLANSSASSSVLNRIITYTGADVVMPAGQCIATLIYDAYRSSWMLMSVRGAGVSP